MKFDPKCYMALELLMSCSTPSQNLWGKTKTACTGPRGHTKALRWYGGETWQQQESSPDNLLPQGGSSNPVGHRHGCQPQRVKGQNFVSY